MALSPLPLPPSPPRPPSPSLPPSVQTSPRLKRNSQTMCRYKSFLIILTSVSTMSWQVGGVLKEEQAVTVALASGALSRQRKASASSGA
jgi:hypothetical protein